MTNTATKPSATLPAFTITPRIDSKLKGFGLGCGLKSYNVQCNDVIRAPFGLQNRPYHTHQQAIDALTQYQAHSPDKEYSINQGGLCSDYYLIDNDWQKTLIDANHFERAWIMQIIADYLNARTLSDDCTPQDLHDASEAAFAAADAIEPLLTSFRNEQHGFSDAMAHYTTQGDALYQAAINAEMEKSA